MYIYFVCVFTYIYKLGIDSMQKYFLFHILIPPVSGVLHLQHAHSFSDFLKLEVSGYYHKLRVLLDTILKAMADFTVKPERFSVIKVIMKFMLQKEAYISSCVSIIFHTLG